MSSVWDKSADAARKILGKDAKVPDLPGAIEKAGTTVVDANKDFDKSREDLKAKLLAVQNANDTVRNNIKQFKATVDKEDFGLDTKKKDDEKKIVQAKKILMTVIDGGIKGYEEDDKILDELDKHVIQLGKYKPKKDHI